MKSYIINPAMERIPLDETEQVLHDSVSGDIHYLDETAIVIIDLLTEAKTADALIETLISMYEGDPEEIRSDTIEFLNELAKKNIILVNDDEN